MNIEELEKEVFSYTNSSSFPRYREDIIRIQDIFEMMLKEIKRLDNELRELREEMKKNNNQ